ncbi:MAG TPA: IclR family transcriptional regulator [Solirubrobacteraceae bacterium]|nr:IclR family transcriptional regulator [Solirubrobacteraceae bacterium]
MERARGDIHTTGLGGGAPDLSEPIGGRTASAGVQATLAILDLIAARGTVQLSEMARELSLAKSTAHRICAILVERGWAIRDQEGRYALGIRALRLRSRSEDLPIVTAFRTVAAHFVNELDETIALAVLDGGESLYLAIEETSQPVRYVTHVGSKTPAFASASGRVMLARQERALVRARFSGRALVTPTGRRLGGFQELAQILDAVADRGYAENVEETANGLYAASVPILNGRGVPLAALTTLVPISRALGDRRATIVDCLRRAGAQLSELVSWLPAFEARVS